MEDDRTLDVPLPFKTRLEMTKGLNHLKIKLDPNSFTTKREYKAVRDRMNEEMRENKWREKERKREAFFKPLNIPF